MTRVHKATKSVRFHNPDEAMTALADKMRTVANSKPERLYKCPTCLDAGWFELEDDHRGTVGRCPKGCSVPDKYAARREPTVAPAGPVSIA